MSVERQTKPARKEEPLPGWRMQMVMDAIFSINGDSTDSLYPDKESRINRSFIDLPVGSKLEESTERLEKDKIGFYKYRFDIVWALHDLPANNRFRKRINNYINVIFKRHDIDPDSISNDDRIRLAENKDGFTYKTLLEEKAA